MGGGSSKRKVNADSKKGNVSNADLKTQPQQVPITQQQNNIASVQQLDNKSSLKGESALFIGNNDDFERDGKKRNLSFMKIEEQSPLKKVDGVKKMYPYSAQEDEDDFNQMKVSSQPQIKVIQPTRVSMSNLKQKSDLNNPVVKGPVKSISFKPMTQNGLTKASEVKGFGRQENGKSVSIATPATVSNNKDDLNLSLDLSKELQGFQNEKNSKIDFSLDISAIYSEDDIETPQQQVQRINEKLQKVQKARKRKREANPALEIERMPNNKSGFAWTRSGECKIMSVSFKVIYDTVVQDLRIVRSYDFQTASSMSWKYNDKINSFDFLLTDNAVLNSVNVSTTQLQNNIITFIVDNEGEFVCIKDEGDFVKKVRQNSTAIHSRVMDGDSVKKSRRKDTTASKTANSSSKRLEKSNIIETTEKNMQKMWEQTISGFQLGVKKNGQNEKIVQNGYNCEIIDKASGQTREKMEDFLRNQLTSSEKFHDTCFGKSSKKLVQDKLRMWDAVDKEQEQLMPKRYRFPVLRKHEISRGIFEPKTNFMRPQAITSDTCKAIVIDFNRDLFVDVEQELKLFVFLWPERGDNQNEIHFYEELSKFKDLCDNALKSLVLDLSRVRALPLSYRPKLKKKYFELY